MRDAGFLVALDAVLPAWRERAEYPLVFAAFRRSAAVDRGLIDDVVDHALWEHRDRSTPLEDVLDQELSRVEACAALDSILRTTLAYDAPWLDPSRADRVAASFVGSFRRGATFLTNGELWRRESGARSWTPLTSATFDTGVIGADTAAAGIVWVADED